MWILKKNGKRQATVFSSNKVFFLFFFCNCRKLLAIKVASFCRNCIVLQKLHRFAKIVSICKNCNAPRKWAGDLTKKKRKINSTILHWKSASIWMIWMTNHNIVNYFMGNVGAQDTIESRIIHRLKYLIPGRWSLTGRKFHVGSETECFWNVVNEVRLWF